MLNISNIKLGSKVALNNEPYEVTKADHHKKGRGGAVLKTKLKSLTTGAVIDKTFQGNDKVEEANLETQTATYLYNDGATYTFMDTTNYDQFELTAEQLGTTTRFLKENEDVEILQFQEKPINVELPLKVELQITTCPPGVKGNTADGGTKEATLETGMKIQVPLFMKEGEIVRINTQTGEYVERA